MPNTARMLGFPPQLALIAPKIKISLGNMTTPTVAFSSESDAAVSRIIGRYPTLHAALIPVLWVAQRQFGTITQAVMELVAERRELPATKVASTATFYSMFNKRPVGRYHVQICKNISCYLRRSDDTTAALAEAIGAAPGETTPDGLFTFSQVECLAACGRAPVVQVNEDYHEWVSPSKARELIASLRAEAGAQPASAPQAATPEGPERARFPPA